LFITLEGGEGAGKSTLARALAQRLVTGGISVRVTREPGGTSLGEDVRRLLRRPGITRHVFRAISETTAWSGMDPIAELFLFEAARAQLVREVIAPALAEGQVVVSDRFTDSTIAYQGYGRGIDIAAIRTANALAAKGIHPDLTVLLDVPVMIGLDRKRGEDESWRGAIGDESIAFFERVRTGFLDLARSEPERWLVVDATQPPEAITETVWARVSALLAVSET
jgi:dTMP kinase